MIDKWRQHVLARIQRNGRAILGELSGQLGISRITIRKYLEHFQSKGLIQRTPGSRNIASNCKTRFPVILTERALRLRPLEIISERST